MLLGSWFALVAHFDVTHCYHGCCGMYVTSCGGIPGVVLKERGNTYGVEDAERQLHISHRFQDYTHWNLDLPPSARDKIQAVFQWTQLSAAVR